MSYDGTMTNTPVLVSPQEFAAIIRVTRRTVYRYIDGGVLTAVAKVGHLWKIDLDGALKELGISRAVG